VKSAVWAVSQISNANARRPSFGLMVRKGFSEKPGFRNKLIFNPPPFSEKGGFAIVLSVNFLKKKRECTLKNCKAKEQSLHRQEDHVPIDLAETTKSKFFINNLRYKRCKRLKSNMEFNYALITASLEYHLPGNQNPLLC
jgi:hypothetical protein